MITLILLQGICSTVLVAGDRSQLRPCKLDWGGDSVLCGTYDVPENRTLASCRTVSLHVMVIPARTENPEPDPIFYFGGGPGVPASDAAYFFAEESAYNLMLEFFATLEPNTIDTGCIQTMVPPPFKIAEEH